MKKLNNKGITLVELIVSFALVSVSVIYFYQTVYTVRSLYSESQKDTQHYVKANYALRLADEYYTTGCKEKTNYKKNVFLNAIDPGTLGAGKEENFCYVTFKVDGKQYKLYKEPIVIKDASSYGYDAMLIGDTNVLGDGTNKYFSFDGDGDFIQLPTLPATIDWERGFIVEFKVQTETKIVNNVERVPVHARILDFANGVINPTTGVYYGSNNIYILNDYNSNNGNNIKIGGRQNASNDSYFGFIAENVGVTDVNTFKFTYIKNTEDNTNYDLKIEQKKANETSFSTKLETITKLHFSNAERKYNYIGKSPWIGTTNSVDEPFKGKIYYVKIDAFVTGSDSMQTILNIDANNYEE